MEKYAVESTQNSRVKKVVDQQPIKSYERDVCIVYSVDSPLKVHDIAKSLNMAHELRQLSPSATKKQMLEIINKYR